MIKQWTGNGSKLAPDPGAYSGVPAETYRGWPGDSKSFLCRARGGYPADWLQESTVTASMRLGSAVDCLIYDGPDTFGARYPELPDLRKKDGSPYVDLLGSKPGMAWREEQERAGRIVLPPSDRAAAIATAAAVMAHPLASLLLAAGEDQVSLYWRVGDRERKGRMDSVITTDSRHWAEVTKRLQLDQEYAGVIVDVKTSGPSRSGRARTPREFRDHAFAYGYHLQLGWYAQGCEATICDDLPWAGALIQATTTDPYPVEVHVLDDYVLGIGESAMERLAALYNRCLFRREWPTTLSAVHPHRMSLEQWQVTREEEM